MNFERVKLLLDIVHGALNVPGTDKIRAAAIEELVQINNGTSKSEKADPELTVGGRRL